MIDALRQCADGRRARREALAHLPGDFGPPVLGHTLKTLASQADFTRGMHARFGLVHRSASFFEEYVMLLGPEANQRVLHRRAMSEPFRAPAMRVYAEQMHDPVARAVASWRARGAVRFYPAVRALTLELAISSSSGSRWARSSTPSRGTSRRSSRPRRRSRRWPFPAAPSRAGCAPARP